MLLSARPHGVHDISGSGHEADRAALSKCGRRTLQSCRESCLAAPSKQSHFKQMPICMQVLAEYGPAFSAASLRGHAISGVVMKDTQQRYYSAGGVLPQSSQEVRPARQPL